MTYTTKQEAGQCFEKSYLEEKTNTLCTVAK